MKPVKIKFKESGLPYRKDYTQNTARITIDDHFFYYHCMLTCQCCDNESGNGSWKEKSANWRVTFNRSSFTGIGIHQDAETFGWGITLYMKGNPQDVLVLNFEDGEEAYDLFKQLEDLHIAYTTGQEPILK